MWIQVRTFDGKQTAQVDGLSKLTLIEELRKKLVEKFDVLPEQQRLFYRGKQLEDGHTLFDYSVGLNEIVQLMIRPALPDSIVTEEKKTPLENGDRLPVTNGLTNGSEEENLENNHENLEIEPRSDPGPAEIDEDQDSVKPASEPSCVNKIRGLYKVGDIVDAKDPSMGAWFEAEIVDVSLADEGDDSSILYHVRYDGYDEDEINKLSASDVRPRARTKLQWEQLSVGQVVMANYNPDEPDERGFWYDVEITQKFDGMTRNSKELYAKLLLKTDENHESVAQKGRIIFTDEIFNIEPAPECSENGEPSSSTNATNAAATAIKRQNKPDCSHCKDDPNKKCKHCNCHQCGGKDDPDKQLLCDECDLAYHIYCLDPPLERIPDDDEWYCPLCKNDASEVIHAGEKLRQNKKKSKMASASSSNRDWGKGMACVGRTKVCTIVPPNHFGSIPGVPVGSSWKFRVQVSEAGIHRPHVSGIHGRDSEGAYSIVLAGGYEDDVDNGEEFIYTGSGGRDLSGNKRTAEQSCDQKLTKMNRALARICAAPLDDKNGAEAKNWKEGKPVRVVRSSKLAKHSKYAPVEGNRYDGLYKVVKYWPEKGISGFIIWRYKLRRDDESPAPWTKDGKKMMTDLGLKMKYPEGYLEAQAKKQEEQEIEKGKGKGKRKRDASDTSPRSSPTKKKVYSLDTAKKKLIAADEENKKVWDEILTERCDLQSFMHKVEETFSCICCQDVVFQPVTTNCGHNFCKACLARSFKAGVYSCPTCRTELGKEYKMTVNSTLGEVLKELFPGYTKGR